MLGNVQCAARYLVQTRFGISHLSVLMTLIVLLLMHLVCEDDTMIMQVSWRRRRQQQ